MEDVSETKTFESLDVWNKGSDFRQKIKQLTEAFPEDEEYRLTDQIIRSSRSINANIAEGYGRYHYQENLQYCRQGRGSLFETLDHLTVAHEEEYITNDQMNELRNDFEELLKLMNGYISYIQEEIENSD